MNIYHMLFIVLDVEIEKSLYTRTEKGQLKGQFLNFSRKDTLKKCLCEPNQIFNTIFGNMLHFQSATGTFFNYSKRKNKKFAVCDILACTKGMIQKF